MIGLHIQGIGTATPAHSVDQAHSAQLAEPVCCTSASQERLLHTLYRRSQVKRRGSVLIDDGMQSFYPPAFDETDGGPTTRQRMQRYESDVTPLSLRAARSALTDAGTAAEQITDIVTVSCTGFAAPGFDIDLVEQLGVRRDVSRTHVGFMGCHGSFNALRVARGLVAANPAARVLMCSAELCSLHLSYGWDPQRIVANALFADGAAAVVCGRGTRGDAWCVTANGSQLVPDSRDAMSWRIGDHGFVMTLSPQVPDLIRAHLKPWLARWLDEQGLRIEDVRSWAVHPGGPRVVAAAAQAIGVPHDAVADSLAVLSESGNMSSATVLFIVQRLRAARAERPCVALGFGPGLTVEAMLLR